jgi:hypothetical protein
MRSQDIQIGMPVRVHKGYSHPHFRGRLGTIGQRYGYVSYAAFDVLFEDGRSELFWYYELEECADTA